VLKLDAVDHAADSREFTVAGRRIVVRRPWFWALAALTAFIVVLGAMFTSVVPMSSDVLRQRIIDTLAHKLDSDVELGTLTIRVFPGLRADGADLRIRRRGTPADMPPLIAVKSFHVDASLLHLWRKHVDHVQLDGLDINIPPKRVRVQQKETINEAKAGDPKPETTPEEKREDPLKAGGVVLDRVDTNDARLIIIPGKPEKAPKVWAIHHLRMHELGSTESWPFEATLTNGVPPGEIQTKGRFGPWDRNEPGDTPVEGSFNFEKADLSVFKGISGTLASSGYFGGTLDQLEANGSTDTPDFTIKAGGHPFPLHVKYTALIDGTNGDTRLTNVDGWFLSSYLHAVGAVLDGPKGEHGRTVSLDVNMDKSRIEDIMKMAVKTATPPMTGALQMSTKFLLPPGEADVVERLQLDGQFVIAQAKFTSYDVQGKIEELSKRASAKTAADSRDHVVSDFRGSFKLANGRLALPDLTFSVPGASVELAGAYGLTAETMDFTGKLLLDAKISQTVTGFKSVLLKAVDPLFKQKDGSGSAIPIRIGGTRNAPDFGLDVKKVLKKGD
jgi:AsmA-like protein